MMHWIVKLFLVVTLFTYSSLSVADLANLYEANVSVTSHSTDELQRLLPQALKEVLVKVSGNAQIDTVPQIKQHYKTAAEWVQQYQYYRVGQRQMLKVTFAKEPINQLLQASGQKIWEGKRPSIVLWLVLDDKKILTTDGASSLLQQIQEIADKRGLTLLIPLEDLSELEKITNEDVSKKNLATLREASKRYAADVIIAATLSSASETDSRWQTQWTLWFGDQAASSKAIAADKQAAVTAGIEGILNSVVTHYVSSSSSSHTSHSVLLSVTGVETPADYVALNQYLRDVGLVSDIQVSSVNADKVEFQLSLDGDVAALQEALKSKSHLQPTNENDSQNLQHLYYQFTS